MRFSEVQSGRLSLDLPALPFVYKERLKQDALAFSAVYQLTFNNTVSADK